MYSFDVLHLPHALCVFFMSRSMQDGNAYLGPLL